MREAVIVSTARTPIGKAYRGAFNDTQAQELGGHVIAEAVKRAGVEPGEVEDVVMGAALQQGSTGGNVARQCAVRAGLPETVPGMSMDRQCASGMMAIATAHMPAIYMTMIETAETVAERYGISREAQDAYAVQSQARTAAAQEAGRFDAEIVPMPSVKLLVNKETGETGHEEVLLTRDEGNRPGTDLDGLSMLKPVFANGMVIKEGRKFTDFVVSSAVCSASRQPRGPVPLKIGCRQPCGAAPPTASVCRCRIRLPWRICSPPTPRYSKWTSRHRRICPASHSSTARADPR